MNISKILKVTSALIALFGAYLGYAMGISLVLPTQEFNYTISISIWVASFIAFVSMFAFGDFVQMQHEIYEEVEKGNKLLSRLLERAERDFKNTELKKGAVKLDVEDEYEEYMG